MKESNIYINVCQSLLPTNATMLVKDVPVKDVAGYIFKHSSWIFKFANLTWKRHRRTFVKLFHCA